MSDGEWRSSFVRCVICTYEWAAAFPIDCDESQLECPSCGAMDSELIEDQQD